jgi:DedD protein
MRLPFLRQPDPSAPAGDDAVAAARTQARRRLVGALVLLVVGVIVFPLLFETQPRPVAVDTPIVTARESAVPAPKAPNSPNATPAAPRPLPPDAGVEVQGAASAPLASAGDAPAPTSSPSPAVTAAATAARAPAVASAPAGLRAAASAPAPKPAAPTAAAERTAAKPAAAASKPAAPRAADGERAQAALAARPDKAPAAAPAAAANGRFVVQVGAFTDPATLREARARVEKLGLKTYTQVIEGDAGKRTRVRVGPFATREEATAAAARLKAAGLPGNVLAL